MNFIFILIMNSPKRTACLAKGYSKNVLMLRGIFLCIYYFLFNNGNYNQMNRLIILMKNIVGLWPVVTSFNLGWWLSEKRKPDTGNRTRDRRTDIYQILVSQQAGTSLCETIKTNGSKVKT